MTSHHHELTRRHWLKKTGLISSGLALSDMIFAATGKKNPIVLLRSGWQIENIGDIAHTPGFMALLEKYMPGARVIFWPHYHYMPDDEVDMMRRRFPTMQVVMGKLSPYGDASTPELVKAIAMSDIFINNSGPATMGWSQAMAFQKMTGKPYGVYGVTYGLYGTPEKEMLSGADFVFFRDSVSLKRAKDEGIHAPIMELGPDAAFATDLRNDPAAIAYLKQNGLEDGGFLCCIPKQRHTPTWEHVHKNRSLDPERHARNEQMKEHDHAPMREAITAVVRQTQLKVLICHEDETQMAIGKTWLLDRLPADVKPRVVWLNRKWLPDEAISIYVRSAGHFGHEMHSPIMCIGNGIPAIVGRWAEQSSKGIMWRDIGLGDWLFDFDNQEDIKRYVPTVLAMAKHPAAAKEKAEAARKRVTQRQKETMAVVADTLRKPARRLKG